eukprot:scaffold7226_cov115-Isochrysis_galbana.AAC.3
MEHIRCERRPHVGSSTFFHKPMTSCSPPGYPPPPSGNDRNNHLHVARGSDGCGVREPSGKLHLDIDNLVAN